MIEVTKIEAATLQASPEGRDMKEVKAMIALLEKQPEGAVVFRRRDARTGEMRSYVGTKNDSLSQKRKFSTLRPIH